MGHINYLNESNTCQNPNYRIGTRDSSETGCQNFVVAHVPPDSCSQSEMLLELSPDGAARVTNEAVFFKAVLSRNTRALTGAGVYARLVADNILQQIGNAYNATTGIFTAPYKGIYSFACQLYLGPISDKMNVGYGGIINGGTINKTKLVDYIGSHGLFRDHLNKVSFHVTEELMLNVNEMVTCYARIHSGASNSVPILGGPGEPEHTRFTGRMVQRLV